MQPAVIGTKNRSRNSNDWHCCRFHTNRKPCDDVRCATRQGCLGDGKNRPIGILGVVLRDPDKDVAIQHSNNTCGEEPHIVLQQIPDRNIKSGSSANRGNQIAAVQRLHWVFLFVLQANRRNPDN